MKEESSWTEGLYTDYELNNKIVISFWLLVNTRYNFHLYSNTQDWASSKHSIINIFDQTCNAYCLGIQSKGVPPQKLFFGSFNATFKIRDQQDEHFKVSKQ